VHVSTLKRQYPQALHGVLPENLGFSGGANRAIAEAFARRSWVLFLTNDCELLNPPATPQEPGLYGGVLLRKNGTIESMGGVFETRRGQLRHLKKPDEFSRRRVELKSAHEYLYIPGHAFIIDRSTWTQHGGFDETFFTYWEDVDLSVRYHRAGVDLAILPDFRVAHAGGKTCRKERKYSSYYYQRNRRVMLRRYSPTPWVSETLWNAQLVSRSIRSCLRRDWEGLQYAKQLWLESAQLLSNIDSDSRVTQES
jgi:GT2 family glycosyltransferase